MKEDTFHFSLSKTLFLDKQPFFLTHFGNIQLKRENLFDVFDEITNEESAILRLINCNHVNLSQFTKFFSFKLNLLLDYTLQVVVMFHWDDQYIKMIFHLSASKIFKASVYKVNVWKERLTFRIDQDRLVFVIFLMHVL